MTAVRRYLAAPRRLTGFSAATYTQQGAVRADAAYSISTHPAIRSREGVRGRLAQLVRAPRLHRGGRRFESCTAHH
jgi:hypothetical protein